MKRSFAFLVALVLLGVVYVPNILSQSDNSTLPWIKVVSDDGIFSAEVPAVYQVFFDRDGFDVSDQYKAVRFSNSFIFNAVNADTLVSIERYDAADPGFGSSLMRESEKRNAKETEIKLPDGTKIKQIISTTKNFYLVRRFVSAGKALYILTAAARSGETPEMKRFLDSVNFSRSSQIPSRPTAIPLSKLRVSPIKIEVKETPAPVPVPATPKPIATEPEKYPFVILVKPRPYYTDSARSKNEQGVVVLRTRFTKSGGIDEITITRQLKEGLLRQAVFAILRTKFIPLNKDGVSRDVIKSVEYTFSIY